MPRYEAEVVKTYEVEALNEQEAHKKIYLLEVTNEQSRLLMGVRTREIPWLKKHEMESDPNLSDRSANPQ